MNEISKKSIDTLGYDFIPRSFLPKGKDEYHLRNMQNRNGIVYRQLTSQETEILVRNSNTSDDWNRVLVSDAFDPELVKNCKFFGLVRIGKLEPCYLEFHDVRLPVGLYNSTIISCDFGDNVVLNNVNYLSHYIIGNEAVIVNVNELATTDHAKFGNGIIKVGENESIRIWLEVCNENAGRRIIPFNDMLPGDAYLWSRFRDDHVLMEKFMEFTQEKGDPQRGYYGKVGDRTIIKNTGIIKDVWIGSDAYIKGANKLKNLTINSSAEEKSQIGEGCELVNGIVGYGCRIFYGVKAVRFILASNSQLKYGARLINSYLGNNATISCCEVLNSLIFPAHEQHHNNSFLCAALVMGQSNIAAGATIGSNHNSRGGDGEMIANRGFWPALCVSLKHNSKFATFTIIAKGDFPSELNIPIPFSLIHNDVANDKLVVMPGYWFMYNMYALARNANKYIDRDKRIKKIQYIEYDFLAPDSVNEMFDSLELMKLFTAKAYARKKELKTAAKDLVKKGEDLLENKPELLEDLEILAEGFENSVRKVHLVKVEKAYRLFKEIIVYYGISELVNLIETEKISTFEKMLKKLPARHKRNEWMSVGGQLIPRLSIEGLIKNIHSGRIKNWENVHDFYQDQGELYPAQKLQHAFASLLQILKIPFSAFNKKLFRELLVKAIDTRTWMVKGIYDSRAKDYTNPFREMIYETKKEMQQVLGKLEENSFIQQQEEELKKFKRQVNSVIKGLRL
jgi:uncharacterized protein DUF4954/uncharacterized protein DUF6819